MPALFLFLLKVNIALVLFCLGYYLVLRHLTFYTLNRIYLVAAIIFSTLYPNINLTDFIQRHQQLTEPVKTVILNWKAPAEILVKPLYQPNYWQWVEVIFWAGVILFAARLLMQLFSLYRLYRRSKPGRIDEHTVRLLKDDIGPFSFWSNIYINPTKLSPTELKNVLEHEQVHVSQWHTADLLLAEMSTIFYWFNPGVWLMKKAVRENIEYITDRKILQKGTDSKEYQYSLVSVSLATMPNTIVNHFNISTIKKRIIMMNSKRSSGYNITRYIFLVPAVVALLLVFSLSKAEISKKSLHAIKKNMAGISNIVIADNDKPLTRQPKKAKALNQARPATIKITGADTLYSGKSKDGQKSILFTSDKNLDSIGYVINGVKSQRADLLAIDPARILSVEMVSAKHASEFMSDLPKKSDIMFITTDDSEAGKKLKEKMDKSFRSGTIAKAYNMAYSTKDASLDKAPSAQGAATMSYSITKSSDDAPEVLVDGTGSNNISAVIVTKADPKVKTKTVTDVKNQIYVTTEPQVAVTVRGSGDQAPSVYSEEIKRPSVDKIKSAYFNKLRNNDELTIDGSGEPLFIIDGKEAKSIKNISPSDIKSITILKDGTAEKKYGSRGKNGVIEIHTKKEK